MKINWCVLLLLCVLGCRTPYQPAVKDVNLNYLIVEGAINSSNAAGDSTIIKLSRTVNLSALSASAKVETGAIISVEDGQGFVFTLKALPTAGTYGAGPMGLNNAKTYRLRIQTTDKKVYLSSLVPVVYTPPITNVNYKVSPAAVNIYASTQNPAKTTRYYRWEYKETWKFHAAYESKYISDGKQILARTPAQAIYYCYNSNNSYDILLASTAKLTDDVVDQMPIAKVDLPTEKVSVRYSILVRQYGLTADGFNFWDVIKKNTSNIGGIFDGQPSQIISNISCTTNPTEPVIGFVSITNIETKRIYINRSDVELPLIFGPTCSTDTLFSKLPSDEWVNNPTALRRIVDTGTIYFPNGGFRRGGVILATQSCMDCTTRGVVAKPAFWVD